MKKKELRILCPNGHMGFAPTKEGSFWIGAKTKPDYYCCDSGSDDIGPGPLGSDTSVSPYAWQKHDLELMLLASRETGGPDDDRLLRRHGHRQPRGHVRGDDPGPGEASTIWRRSSWSVSIPNWTRPTCSKKMAKGRRRRGAGRPHEPDDGRAGKNRSHRGRGRRSSVHQGPADGGRRHHRRPQQRCRDFCRGGDVRGVPGKPLLLPGQGPGVRLLLRRTLHGQGNGHRHDYARRCESHRIASANRDAPLPPLPAMPCTNDRMPTTSILQAACWT